MENALKRLDKLTQEEARMAVAQNLKATHTIDERVRGVANAVVVVDNGVAGVGDQVAGVDDRVAGIDDKVEGIDARVAGVDDRVKAVDDKVTEAVQGAQFIFSKHKICLIWTAQTERKQIKSSNKLLTMQIKSDVCHLTSLY